MKEWTLSSVIKVVLATVVGTLAALLGGWDRGMQILLIFVVLDVVSGVIRAVVQKQVSSDESFRGGLKKLLIFVVVAIATQVDRFAETNLVRNMAIAYYVASEALSVLENVVASGVSVPPSLKKVLKALSGDKFPPVPPPAN